MTATVKESAGKTLLLSRALLPDGHRVKLHPLETHGRFSSVQAWLFPALMLFYAALPWIHVGGHPAVLLDIEQRRFFLFGATFNSTDFYLVFFLLSGMGFSLIVVSALFGRAWCGYACPQTVFLEGLFRRIERLVEGPARKRQAQMGNAWNAERVVRLVVKHALFIMAALLVAHLLLAYFASTDSVLWMMRQSPFENPTPFVWVMVFAAVLYFNFAWFREQLCIVVCPYGRLQGALYDRDTVAVGYDSKRGEPRGKKGGDFGDCVDCHKCVQVCPTGIDIRNGGQLECIGCGHCVEVCDDVMDTLHRPRGLIRYDSLNGLEGLPRRFLRPRVYGYAAAGVLGLAALTAGLSHRSDFDASLLRAQTNPREVQGQTVVERFVVHVASKSAEEETFSLVITAPEGAQVVLPMDTLKMQPFESRHVPLVVIVPLTQRERGEVLLRVTTLRNGESRHSALPL